MDSFLLISLIFNVKKSKGKGFEGYTFFQGSEEFHLIKG